uniref:Uncharacterized protein n=1 Tax=Compsopogon caeruleus TaxID=31354 RepID=A0A7S1TF54_9RHOD|mmetsp:Transcript_4481/g.8920  ORF Transcript_4481/g.8920 Transcript_4481/m.8920 type:complete len:105 (+) Transcript_4481:395-709(+)
MATLPSTISLFKSLHELQVKSSENIAHPTLNMIDVLSSVSSGCYNPNFSLVFGNCFGNCHNCSRGDRKSSQVFDFSMSGWSETRSVVCWLLLQASRQSLDLLIL